MPLPEGRVQLVERLGSGLGFWAGGDGEPVDVAVVKRDGPEAGARSSALEPCIKRHSLGDRAPRVVAGVGHAGIVEAAGPHCAADPVRAHHDVEALFAAVGEGDCAASGVDAHRFRRGVDAGPGRPASSSEWSVVRSSASEARVIYGEMRVSQSPRGLRIPPCNGACCCCSARKSAPIPKASRPARPLGASVMPAPPLWICACSS